MTEKTPFEKRMSEPVPMRLTVYDGKTGKSREVEVAPIPDEDWDDDDEDRPSLIDAVGRDLAIFLVVAIIMALALL